MSTTTRAPPDYAKLEGEVSNQAIPRGQTPEEGVPRWFASGCHLEGGSSSHFHR